MWSKLAFGLLGWLLLLGCGQSPTPPLAATQLPLADGIPTVAAPSPVAQLPATFTPRPAEASPTPGPTRPPATPAPTNTPIQFDQTAVEVRYQIPALGLDRRLQGNINSQIIYVDETSGAAFQRNNQASILLELQQVLPNLELSDIPDGCDSCVHLSYELPVRGEAGSGWLQDMVLLASIENLMVVNLGPHWPPDAVVGLRRTASAYEPAHTVALAADGRLWSWLATMADVGSVQSVNPDLLLDQPDWPPVPAAQYIVSCPGVAIETVWWQLSPDESTQTTISCPEFSLPFRWVPIYSQLSQWAEPALETLGAERRPPASFPLEGWLLYQRSDGSRLTLWRDGRLTAIPASTNGPISSTLSLDIAAALVSDLLAADLVAPGLETFFAESETAVSEATLLIRAENGVYDGRVSPGNPAVADLNQLLDELLETAVAPDEP